MAQYTYISFTDRHSLSNYTKMLDDQGILYKVSRNPAGGGWRVRFITGSESEAVKKKAREAEIQRQIEKESIKEEVYKERKAETAPDFVTIPDMKAAKRLGKYMEKQGYEIRYDDQGIGGVIVRARSKLTGTLKRWDEKELEKVELDVAKAEPPSYKQIVRDETRESITKFKTRMTPKQIGIRTVDLTSKIAKDETAKTLKVTSEHSDVIGGMKKAIPGTRGSHPAISSIDSEGINRVPRIMSQPRLLGSGGFTVNRNFVYDPRSAKTRKKEAYPVNEEMEE